MNPVYKLGWFPDGSREEKYYYPNVWVRERTATGQARIAIAPQGDYVALIEALTPTMAEPYLLLYVLVVARDENQPLRYQSATPLSAEELLTFLQSYRAFLECDARHNLWIRAADNSMLVYERHNVIYAYENLEQILHVLNAFGLTEAADTPSPGVHAHHYHPEFDSSLTSLLGEREWVTSPLRKGDTNPSE